MGSNVDQTSGFGSLVAKTAIFFVAIYTYYLYSQIFPENYHQSIQRSYNKLYSNIIKRDDNTTANPKPTSAPATPTKLTSTSLSIYTKGFNDGWYLFTNPSIIAKIIDELCPEYKSFVTFYEENSFDSPEKRKKFMDLNLPKSEVVILDFRHLEDIDEYFYESTKKSTTKGPGRTTKDPRQTTKDGGMTKTTRKDPKTTRKGQTDKPGRTTQKPTGEFKCKGNSESICI